MKLINLALNFSILLSGAGLLTHPASAQENCEAIRQEAENSYDAGDFDRTLALLQQNCFKFYPARLDSTTGVAAYRLLALTYIARDLLDKAQQAVDQMTAIRVSKNAVVGDSLLFFNEYPVDPINQDSPTFVAMVKKAEQPYRKKVKKIAAPFAMGRSFTNRWWFKVGAPVLSAGIATGVYYLVTREKKLPDPPALP